MNTVPSVHVRRATARDVDAIFRLTNDNAREGLMLPRSKYKIVTTLANFMVAELKAPEMSHADGNPADGGGNRVVGCGAFSMLWTDMGEIMSLSVAGNYRRRGIGGLLVRSLIEEGRRMRVDEIITLTYQTDFFKNLGFALANKDQFPRKLWRECLECPKLEQCDETAMHLKL